MKKIGLFLIGCLMCAGSALAQQVHITGVVTDANDGSPLIGVTVMVEGTTTATTTDYNLCGQDPRDGENFRPKGRRR